MPDVVTVGETMVLFTPMGDGPLRAIHHFEKRIGGAETNVSIGLARLGHSAGWISRVGDDEFGRFILASVRGEGVDVSRVAVDPEAPTGIYFKERRPLGGGRVFYYRRGSAASRLTPSDLDESYLRSARVFLGTGITPALSPNCRETLQAAVRIAKDSGIAFAFDPNLRLKLWPAAEARRVLLDFARQADLLFPGAEEAEFLTGISDPALAGRRLLELGPRLVVVKLGKEGALVVTADGDLHVPGFPIERVVDPVGAGDAFLAGFLAGYLEGKSLEESARLANACGALALTVPGDIEGLPERAEVERIMRKESGPDVHR